MWLCGYQIVCVCVHVCMLQLYVWVCSYKAVCLDSGSLRCCNAVVHQIDLCLLVDDSLSLVTADTCMAITQIRTRTLTWDSMKSPFWLDLYKLYLGIISGLHAGLNLGRIRDAFDFIKHSCTRKMSSSEETPLMEHPYDDQWHSTGCSKVIRQVTRKKSRSNIVICS